MDQAILVLSVIIAGFIVVSLVTHVLNLNAE
jgi:hypothetical protein